MIILAALSILIFLLILFFIIYVTINTANGASGASGQSGVSGTAGQPGSKGPSGSSGVSGSPGLGQSGISGLPGQQGQPGASGNPGPSGIGLTSRIIPISPIFNLVATPGSPYIGVLSGNSNPYPDLDSAGNQAAFVADADGVLTNLQVYANLVTGPFAPFASNVVSSVYVAPAGVPLNSFVKTPLSVTAPVDSADHYLTSAAIVPVLLGDRIVFLVETLPFDTHFQSITFNASFDYNI